MSFFSIGQVRHLTSTEVEDEVDAWFNCAGRDGEIISDSAAATIAGWFASADEADLPFTVLAQQGSGDTIELATAITQMSDAADEDLGFSGAGLMLVALEAWLGWH